MCFKTIKLQEIKGTRNFKWKLFDKNFPVFDVRNGKKIETQEAGRCCIKRLFNRSV